MTASRILFWVAAVLMADSAIGMLGGSRLQKRLPEVPIRKIAQIEAGAAVLLLLLSLLIRREMD